MILFFPWKKILSEYPGFHYTGFGTAINGRRLASLRTQSGISDWKEVMHLNTYETLMIVFTVIGLLIACSRK